VCHIARWQYSVCIHFMFCCVDIQLLALRFSNDQRLNEVRRLLISSQPVRIAIPQRPEVRSVMLVLLLASVRF